MTWRVGQGNDDKEVDYNKDSKDSNKDGNNQRRGSMLVHLKMDVGTRC